MSARLQPCVACGCFVHLGASTCPHCTTEASSLGRKVVHASVIATLGAATACVNTPLYGVAIVDGTVVTAAGDTADTETDNVLEPGTAGDTGAP